MKYRTPIQKLSAAMNKEMNQRQTVLSNASIRQRDVIAKLAKAGTTEPGVVDELKNVLATIEGMTASLDELKS